MEPGPRVPDVGDDRLILRRRTGFGARVSSPRVPSVPVQVERSRPEGAEESVKPFPDF